MHACHHSLSVQRALTLLCERARQLRVVICGNSYYYHIQIVCIPISARAATYTQCMHAAHARMPSLDCQYSAHSHCCVSALAQRASSSVGTSLPITYIVSNICARSHHTLICMQLAHACACSLAVVRASHCCVSAPRTAARRQICIANSLFYYHIFTNYV